MRMMSSSTAPPMSVRMSTSCAPDISSMDANTPLEPKISIAAMNRI
jgi:hypothetical protein